MKLKELTIWLLMRLYPAAWRREFGAEFEELLQHGPLSLPVIANVAAGALGERVVHVFRRIAGGGEMADRTFGARYDRLTKIVSVCVVAILVAVPVMALQAGWTAVVAALVSTVVLALSFAFSPRGYEISGGALRIKRLVGDVVFPLDQLSFVRDATASDFWGSVRLWGSGGLFGYYGWFWSNALGRSRWYVTDRNKSVVLSNGGQFLLVSPDNHDEFVAALRSAGPERLARTTQPGGGGFSSELMIGIVIGGAALGLVAAAMLYAPGRPPVDLTRDSLVIHSRFYGMTVPASSVDVANVRVVDLQVESGWKPVVRTGGFGNPNYRAGNFRTANGRAVKLFTTGSPQLVILPPSQKDGTPVLLDVADPVPFAAQVRQAWRGR